ncbi:MAG: dUTPase, partial [Candidatus Eutrophobiaceae bacterium]
MCGQFDKSGKLDGRDMPAQQPAGNSASHGDNPTDVPQASETVNLAHERDMLARIFDMQKTLNDQIFLKQGLTGLDGSPLSMDAIMAAATEGRLGVNDLPNRWLANYARALRGELAELEEEVLWKWWSRDELDMQNIRVELIDLLHFLISAMLCAGMDAKQVFSVYEQKRRVNQQRQEQGYSREKKDE